MEILDYQYTKIVATVGPSSSSYESLFDLVKAGVHVFRLNFSHGTQNEHLQVIDRIRYINEKYGSHVGILADLQGPKLRVGEIENNSLPLKKGDVVTFTNKNIPGTLEQIYMSYENFAEDVKIGEKVLVDDGKLVLEVIETNKKDTVQLKVLFGGILSSNKGVNLPDTEISLPSLTEKDLRDLEFILTQPVNWIALSFVRKSKDIQDLARIIRENKHSAKTISKIEKPEAINNIDEIIESSDAIMIARGDLGVEVPIEKLPGIQKKIIKKCIQKARPVIVATQLMESMITNPSPTRAEVTDVANAVLDGTDAVMLSGETSIGAHPIRVVKAMNKIIYETELHLDLDGRRPIPDENSDTFYSDVINFNAARVAEEVNAHAIIGMTVSGYTAFRISSFRPIVPVYIFSERRDILSTLSLVWGVKTYYYDKFTTTDETHADVIEILKKKGHVTTGDIVVNTGSMPIHKRLRTNMLKLTKVE